MKNHISLICIIIVIWYFFPVLSILLLILVIKVFQYQKIYLNLIFILISLSLGLLCFTQTGNAGRLYDSDIERYYIVYNQFANMSFDMFIMTRFLADPNLLFDLINFSLASLWPNTPQVLSLFWISLSFFLNFKSIDLLTFHFGNSFRYNHLANLVFYFVFIFSIFTFSTDIIKQFAATSLFIFSLTLKIDDKSHSSLLFFGLSFLIHTSVFILSPIYFFSKTFRRALSIKSIILIFLGFLLLSNLSIVSEFLSNFNLGYLNLLAKKANFVSTFEIRWSIRYWHIIVFLFFGVSVFYSNLMLKRLKTNFRHESFSKLNYKKFEWLVSISIMSFILLLTNLINVQSFLRYLNTYGLFYLIPMLFLLDKIKGYVTTKRIFFILPYICFFAFYSNYFFYLRSIDPNRPYGVSFMDNDYYRLLASNVIDILNHHFN